MNKKEFIEKFQTMVELDINELEKERDINLRKNIQLNKFYKFSILLFFFCLFFSIFLVFKTGNGIFIILLPFSFLLFAFSYVLKKRPEKNYLNFIKEKYLNELLKVFGNIQKTDKTFEKQTLLDSELFRSFTRMRYDDSFIGSYKNTDFFISELELIQDGSKKSYTVFKGVVIKFSSKKNYNGQLNISTKYSKDITYFIFLSFLIFFIFALISGIIQLFLEILTNPLYINAWFALFFMGFFLYFFIYSTFNLIKPSKSKKIEIKYKDFMKKYEITTSKNIIAKQIITPTFIKRYRELEKTFDDKYIQFSLVNNNIMIAIDSNKNLFELANINTQINSNKFVGDFYNQIIAIYKMIDYFNKNNEIE